MGCSGYCEDGSGFQEDETLQEREAPSVALEYVESR